MIKQILLFSILLTFAFSRSTKFVFEMFRHGARAPEDLFDVVNREDFIKYRWSVDAGMLTAVGEMQHFILGSGLRKRYITENPFLSSDYNENEVKVICSGYPRTLQSAQYHLSGLFPAETFNQLIIKQTKTSPGDISIPFNIHISNIEDHFLNINKTCKAAREDPNYNKEAREQLNDFVISNFYPELLSETNYPDLATIKSKISEFMTDIMLSQTDGYQLSLNMKTHFIDTGVADEYLRRHAEFIMNASQNEIASRVEISPVLNMLIKQLEGKLESNDKTENKMLIISAHDTQLVSIQRVLKLVYDFKFATPYLASNIIIELFEEGDELLIEVEMNGESAIREEVKLFIEKIRKYVYSDEEEKEVCCWQTERTIYVAGLTVGLGSLFIGVSLIMTLKVIFGEARKEVRVEEETVLIG